MMETLKKLIYKIKCFFVKCCSDKSCDCPCHDKK